jgi:hypothetical protein
VFTAQYALSPYIKQIRFVFKELMEAAGSYRASVVCIYHPRRQLCPVPVKIYVFNMKHLWYVEYFIKYNEKY